MIDNIDNIIISKIKDKYPLFDTKNIIILTYDFTEIICSCVVEVYNEQITLFFIRDKEVLININNQKLDILYDELNIKLKIEELILNE